MTWRAFFPIVFLYSLIEGFIQHKLYPWPLPILFKDFLVIILYFLFLLSKESAGILYSDFSRNFSPQILPLLLIFFLIGMIQIFNPQSSGIVMGLLGLKIYYLYIPLALLGYAYIERLSNMTFLLGLLALASIPVNIFGLIQFFGGPTYIQSLGPGFNRAVFMAALGEGISHTESFVRIFSTFASSGIYSGYLLINTMVCFALIFTVRRTNQRLLWVAALSLNFIALLAAGSRGALMFAVLQVGVLSVFLRQIRSILVGVLVSGIAIFVGFNWLGRGVKARFNTLKDVPMIRERAINATHSLFVDELTRNPLGKGIGSATIGARHLAGGLKVKVAFVENFPTKLQVEFGIVGVIIFYMFLGSLLIHWILRWIPVLRESTAASLAIPISTYCICHLFVASIFSILDSPPGYFFIWPFLGMVVKFKKLAETEADQFSPQL